MAGIGALISSLVSSAAKLLPEIQNSFFVPSSSSPAQLPNTSAVEDDLNKLIRTLKRIKATLYDAEEREIRDSSVKLWLKELKEVGRAAEYVIDEYMYEVYRAKIEARNAFELNPRKRKEEGSGAVSCARSIRIPDGFVDRIRDIRSRFDEIANDREALRLREEDGERRNQSLRFRAPSSHLILESNVFGRERDKEKVIDLLFLNFSEEIISVTSIIGKGGIGKTTLAQLVYNDRRVQQNFDLHGWICVSEDFNIERLLQELIESFTKENCSIKNLSTLQEKFKEITDGKKIIIVLDDVWNEDKRLWELFSAHFSSVLRASFIVTTRNDQVAKIMKNCSPFRPGCLSEKESWSLFQHYAFGGIYNNVHPNLLDLGKQITKKCNGLPLAVKSISSLLRYEDEESWIEILKNDFWEIHAENDILVALQISYTRMPAYLRPCFVYCSMFPKDYEYDVDEMIELWIVQGYIETKGRRTLEEVASEYTVELRERSFFDPIHEQYRNVKYWKTFKMHDMVHDLARLYSGNEWYFIERGNLSNLPDEVLHIYIYYNREGRIREYFDRLFERHNSSNVTRLRTLLNADDSLMDLSEAKNLRVLKLHYHWSHFVWLPSTNISSIFFLYHLEKLELVGQNNSIKFEMLGNLINLKFLSISNYYFDRIPESLGSLSNLRRLSIRKCNKFSVLPESLGSLSNLRRLSIRKCYTFSVLPESLGSLSNLRRLSIHKCKTFSVLPEALCKLSNLKILNLTYCSSIMKLPDKIGNLTSLESLVIHDTGINYLPHSFRKLNIFGELFVKIDQRLDKISDTIGWLKDFNILKGALIIFNLGRMPSLEDARNFNLISKPNLGKLAVSWRRIFFKNDEKNVLQIELIFGYDFTKRIENISELLSGQMDFQVFESLQPHPNLKHLCVDAYEKPVFPGWVGNPLSCASLEKIEITSCYNITYLPFGNLGSLKELEIHNCDALQTITADSLPSQLQQLVIWWCSSLISVIGLEDLESLDRLVIDSCNMLDYFPFALISEERYHKSTSSGLKHLSPPKEVNIRECSNLKLAENEIVPAEHCNIEIFDCSGLKDWCLRHNIKYDELRGP